MSLNYFFVPMWMLLLFTALSVAAQEPGEILMSPVKFGSYNKADYSELVILSEKWDTLQYKKIDGVFLSSFNRWNTSNGIRYTYYMQDTNAYVPRGTRITSGHMIVADEHLNVLNKLYMLPHGRITGTYNTVDGHDFIYLNDDHYILLCYNEEIRNNIPAGLRPSINVRVISSVIQEVKDGKVIWQWDSADYPELYAASQMNNDFGDTAKAQDYLHVNSIFIDPKDHNLIVSCKNSNQILKLDRKKGSIIWRLGGDRSDFSMAPEQKFIHQHHVTITKDRKILLFDNGDEHRPNSRVLEFRIDEKKRQITEFRSIPLNGLYTPAAGSVQKTGYTYFISTGTVATVLEIDAQTIEIRSSKHLPYGSYRVLKY